MNIERVLRRALVSGSVASATSGVALAAMSLAERGSAPQALNATSHWLHGDRAARVRRLDVAHTGTGLRHASRGDDLLGSSLRGMARGEACCRSPEPSESRCLGRGAGGGRRLHHHTEALYAGLGTRDHETGDGGGLRRHGCRVRNSAPMRLARRPISAQPDAGCGKFDEGEKAGGMLLATSSNGLVVLEYVE